MKFTYFSKFLPVLEWLPSYPRENLKGDVSAGLTVAVMLIPQGMAYAMLAGLPPITGLYASLLPLFVYALFGTSRQLAVGPVAIVSLLVASSIGAIMEPGNNNYIILAAVLAGMVGIIQFLMGITRLGFLVNFLSHPVISGFTSAAALIIGFSQLKHLLGIAIPRSHHVHTIIFDALQNCKDINLPTFLIGLGSIIILVALKRWKPIFPGALAVVALSTTFVWGLDLHTAGVKIVGDIPAGFPNFSLPKFDYPMLTSLLPAAVTISFVGFMESIAVAKSFAARNRYSVDANKELVGLGLANMAAGLCSAYPVTGGFSRTAVNAQAGARSPLSSMITAAGIALVLLFLTSLFYYLPNAVLAAIIMVAVFGLIDIKQGKHLYRVKRTDLTLLLFAFFATLIFGIENGILLSVGVSLILVLKCSTRPHSAVLGQIPGTKIYRNVERYTKAVSFDGLLIFRIDVSLYFANIGFLKDRLQELVSQSASPLKVIIFDGSSINNIDSSADTALHELAENYQSRGIKLFFSNLKGPVRDVLKNSGFYEKLGADHFFYNNHDAVKKYLQLSPFVPNEKPQPVANNYKGKNI